MVSPFARLSPAEQEPMHDQAREVLTQAAGDDARCLTHTVADSSPARALQSVAESRGADLIIIGSSHRSAVGRVLLGSVSRATLNGAPCAVAVAPHGYRDGPQPIATIGVGVNDTPESNAALNYAVQIARDTGAKLHLLTAINTPTTMGYIYLYAYDWTEIIARDHRAAEQQLAQVVETLDVPAESQVVDGNAGLALEKLSEHVDLLVSGSRGWGPVARVMLGSTSERLTHHAHCPVIIVPGTIGDRAAAART
jgi:nucleotide-binding universal stress UspA family protein